MIPPLGGPLSRSERVGLAIGLLLAGALMWPLRHSLVDTAFVWLRFAQHLANGQGLVFNPGERLYATTNPLWISLIADGIGLGLDGLMVARLLGAAATLVTIVLFMQLMRRTVRTPAVRAVATVAWAGYAWMLQGSVTGLETPLATALVLAGFVALTEGPEWGDRPVRTGSLWALAALTRPGAVLLLVLWVTALLVDARNRPGLRRLVFGSLPAIAIYGSWLLFARLYFGTFWPRVLSMHGAGGTPATMASRLGVELAGIVHTDGALLVVGALAILVGLRRKDRAPMSALRMLPWLWVFMLPALLASRGLGIAPRHLMIMIPVLHGLAWQAIDAWWAGDQPKPRAGAGRTALAIALGVVVLAQSLVVYATRVLPETRAETATREASLLRWGRWLGTHAPRRAVIASETPGIVAVASGLRVLDLDGLLSAGVLDVRARVPHEEIIPRLAFEPVARAEYVVDFGRTPEELRRVSPYPEAFRLIESRPPYVLYGVDWAKVDTLRASSATP